MSIRIDCQLSYQDMREYQKAHPRIGPRPRLIARIIADFPYARSLLIYLAITAVYVIPNLWRNRPLRASDFSSGVIFLIIFAVITVYEQIQYRRKLKHQPVAHYEFDVDGITHTEELSRQQYGWSYIISFVENKTLFLLYIDQDHAFVIPKRLFASPDEQNSFRALVQEQMAGARHDSDAQSDHADAKSSDSGPPLIVMDVKLSYEDIREFRRRHDAIRPGSKWYNRQTRLPDWCTYAFLACVVLASAFFTVKVLIKVGPYHREIWLFVAVCLALLVFGLIFPYFGIRRTKRQIAMQLPLRHELYAKRLVIYGQDSVQDFELYFFIKFTETKNLYILYYTEANALAVPKRAFASPAESQRFRDIVQAGITRTKGFPITPINGPLTKINEVLTESVEKGKCDEHQS